VGMAQMSIKRQNPTISRFAIVSLSILVTRSSRSPAAL
jgi:hypothetical protein